MTGLLNLLNLFGPIHWFLILATIASFCAVIYCSVKLNIAHKNMSRYAAEDLDIARLDISDCKKYLAITFSLLLVFAIATVFYFTSTFGNHPSDTPVGTPLEPSITDAATGEVDGPDVGNLSNETDVTNAASDKESEQSGSEKSEQQFYTEVTESFHLVGDHTLDLLKGDTKGYYVPAVNPTEDEITEYLKDFDLEVGYDHSLTDQKDARVKAAAQFSGKYTDPVNFPLPEEYRTGFQKAKEGKLTQPELEELVKKFRHWLTQEMISNPPYGEMILQTLNKLDRVTKNNQWIPNNEAVIERFYAGTYQQPQLGDANYAELMKIELNAIPTDAKAIGLDYLLDASDQSPTKFKPREIWARLMARTSILLDRYFDVEGYVECESSCNWRMPDYNDRSKVRTKEAPYQVDEPAILFAYRHTTGEEVEFGSAEFGIVEDDCRTELYAGKKAPKQEATPPPTNPPPTTPPGPNYTPTPTPSVTPTPTPIVTPTPTPTPGKNPSKGPANQGNTPIGGGSNSDPTNPGTPQPTKPPAISKPGQGSDTPLVDTTGSGKHESTGTGGNPNSVVNPGGNTINGDHPGQGKIDVDNSETWHQPTGGGGGSTPVKPSESVNDDGGAFTLD